MWKRIRLALMVLFKGEGSLLEPLQRELDLMSAHNKAEVEALRLQNKFIADTATLLSKEAIARITELEQEIAKHQERENRFLSSLRFDKGNLPN